MKGDVQALLEELTGQNILISFHTNADPDAVASAVALTELLRKKLKCKVKIVYEELSKISLTILDFLNISLDEISDEFSDFKYLILVDTNNLVQTTDSVASLEFEDKKIIVIDHHAPHKDVESFAYKTIIEPDTPSTSEIIFKISKLTNYELSAESKFLILSGITYDSRHFILGKKDTFHIAYQLIRDGVNYPKIIELLHHEKEISEKIARLKSAKRAALYLLGGRWVLAISNVGSFESSACRALVELGADIAVVINVGKQEVRISARSTTDFYNATNLHLGKELMEPLGSIVEGEGGGHNTAAGCNGVKYSEAVLDEILKLLKNKVSPELKLID